MKKKLDWKRNSKKPKIIYTRGLKHAARVIIKSYHIKAKNVGFCDVKALLTLFCGPRRHFLVVMWPESSFFVIMRTSNWFEFETPDLHKSLTSIFWKCIGGSENLKRFKYQEPWDSKNFSYLGRLKNVEIKCYPSEL